MASQNKILSQTLYVALLFFGGFCIYSGLGAFLGALRTDEIYFLTTATWLLDGYRPTFDYDGSFYVLFRHLLGGYFLASGQSYASLWGIRVINLILSIVQCICIYSIWHQAFAKWIACSRPLSLFIATVYFVMMASFRGYEIRPEIIPITLFLWAIDVSMRIASLESISGKDWILIITSLLGLVFAGSISIRMAIPSFIIFMAIAIQAFQKRASSHWGILSVAIGMPIVAAIMINVVWINFYSLYIVGARERAYNPHFDWFLKLTIGESSPVFLVIKLVLLLSLIGAIAFRFRRIHAECVTQLQPLFIALIFSLASFYLFLGLLDFRPFEYVRAIEWSLLACLTPFILMTFSPNTTSIWIQKLVSSSIIVIVLTIGYLSAQNIYATRNTAQALSSLLNARSINELSVMRNHHVIHHLITGSLLEQLWARQVYCERYPEGKAIVADWSTHPICMKDAGSLAYSGWDGDMHFGQLPLIDLYYMNLTNQDKIELIQLKPNFEFTDGIWHR